jgi:hypothetical protein
MQAIRATTLYFASCASVSRGLGRAAAALRTLGSPVALAWRQPHAWVIAAIVLSRV